MEDREEERSEQPVRSRWTPKPDQILILESIFNSGMVNPPKDETVRIRKLLEKFGSVGDANVFYWFQNRRSRSRRRQRQIQASLCAPVGPGSSSSFGLSGSEAANADGFLSFPGQQELQHSSFSGPRQSSDSHYQSGGITVMINGVATEVGRGGLDMKAMFGEDYVLLDSSGVAVEEANHSGRLVLHHAQSYFLVPRHS